MKNQNAWKAKNYHFGAYSKKTVHDVAGPGMHFSKVKIKDQAALQRAAHLQIANFHSIWPIVLFDLNMNSL